MIHGDDLGLVLPPRVAPLQVIVIPDIDTGEAVRKACTELMEMLKGAGIAVRVDLRKGLSSQVKHKEWERKVSQQLTCGSLGGVNCLLGCSSSSRSWGE
jgi:prolyl-tRNA synthetase